MTRTKNLLAVVGITAAVFLVPTTASAHGGDEDFDTAPITTSAETNSEGGSNIIGVSLIGGGVLAAAAASVLLLRRKPDAE